MDNTRLEKELSAFAACKASLSIDDRKRIGFEFEKCQKEFSMAVFSMGEMLVPEEVKAFKKCVNDNPDNPSRSELFAGCQKHIEKVSAEGIEGLRAWEEKQATPGPVAPKQLNFLQALDEKLGVAQYLDPDRVVNNPTPFQDNVYKQCKHVIDQRYRCMVQRGDENCVEQAKESMMCITNAVCPFFIENMHQCVFNQRNNDNSYRSLYACTSSYPGLRGCMKASLKPTDPTPAGPE